MAVIYTRLLFWAKGMALTPDLVLIHPSGKDDAGLLAHEKLHCEQLARVGVLAFWWKYITDRAFRQQMEVEAYKVSLAYSPQSLDKFAEALASNYMLDITVEQAKTLLITPATSESTS